MKLPDFGKAIVLREKLTGYLLSSRHPNGRHKAVFFAGLGFRASSWETLGAALKQHASAHSVASEKKSTFGTRYAIDGPILSPIGVEAKIRSIWFIEAGGVIPYFVTAYPLKKDVDDKRT